MAVKSQESKPIASEDDIGIVRNSVKRVAALLNFSQINQTKLVTAASELARNTIEHGKGGQALIQMLEQGDRIGVRVEFEDRGPGIPDVDKAMEDGYTTGKGMGLGLGGAKRLTDEFSLESTVGTGTKVAITKWQDKS